VLLFYTAFILQDDQDRGGMLLAFVICTVSYYLLFYVDTACIHKVVVIK